MVECLPGVHKPRCCKQDCHRVSVLFTKAFTILLFVVVVLCFIFQVILKVSSDYTKGGLYASLSSHCLSVLCGGHTTLCLPRSCLSPCHQLYSPSRPPGPLSFMCETQEPHACAVCFFETGWSFTHFISRFLPPVNGVSPRYD